MLLRRDFFSIALVVLSADFLNYLFTLVFQKYDPNFIAASLDEAYLDITNVCQERGITGADVSYSFTSKFLERLCN